MKLFLDVDDTIFDTKGYIRELLGGEWLTDSRIIYSCYEDMTFRELNKVITVFSNYNKVPFKIGAYDGLNILKSKYDVVLCSSYKYSCEYKAKEAIAKRLNTPIILCGGKNWDKSHIDMSDSVFVDNNTRILNLSNASRKVCFYQQGNLVEEFRDGDIVFNWSELLDKLC